MSDDGLDTPNTSPVAGLWTSQPGNGLPWWLADELTGPEGTVVVRCLAMVAAFLADELELPAGTLPALLRAALEDYGRADGPVGIEAGLRSLFDAVRIAFG